MAIFYDELAASIFQEFEEKIIKTVHLDDHYKAIYLAQATNRFNRESDT